MDLRLFGVPFASRCRWPFFEHSPSPALSGHSRLDTSAKHEECGMSLTCVMFVAATVGLLMCATVVIHWAVRNAKLVPLYKCDDLVKQDSNPHKCQLQVFSNCRPACRPLDDGPDAPFLTTRALFSRKSSLLRLLNDFFGLV